MTDYRTQACVKPLNMFECQSMDNEQTNMMLGCSIADPAKLTTVIASMDSSRDFLWQVFSKRAKAVGLNLEDKLRMFIVGAVLQNPAQSTQMLHAIYHDHTKAVQGKSEAALLARLEEVYTLDAFCHLFPIGFPTEESWRAAWEAQKCDTLVFGSDNLLDTSAFFVKWSE